MKEILRNSTKIEAGGGILRNNNFRAKSRASLHERQSAYSGKSKRSASDLSGLSRDVQLRLTGNYEKDRGGCSTHQHRDFSVRPPPIPPKEYVSRGCSPRSELKDFRSRASQTPEPEDDVSIEEVNVEELHRELKDIGNDPIFGSQDVYNIQTQTEATVGPTGKLKILKEDLPVLIDYDWANSNLYKMVVELLTLPEQNRIKLSRRVEKKYFNPFHLDIFSEEETNYNASLLRKKREAKDDQAYDQMQLEDLNKKARHTIQVLSDFLLLSVASEDDVIDQLQIDKE